MPNCGTSYSLVPFLSSSKTASIISLFNVLISFTDRNDSNYRKPYNQQGSSGGNNYQQQQQRGYSQSARPTSSYNSNNQQNNRGAGYSQWRSERGGHRNNQDRGNYGQNQSGAHRGGYQRYNSEQNQRYHSARPDRVQGPPTNHYGGAYSRQ